jgi:hypothetical protein
MSLGSGVLVGPANERRDYSPVLRWLLLNVLIVIGVITLWYFNLLQTTLGSDRTHISILILLVFVATALHCLYQTVVISRELNAARRIRETIETTGAEGLRLVDRKVITSDGQALEPSIMTGHIGSLLKKAEVQGEARFDQSLLLRSLADRLRGREKIGLFMSEGLLRLALLGTAVGFILMLIPLAGLNSFEPDTLRTALSGMTGGMSVALTVTVTGIATALILKFEYYLLDGSISELFAVVTETSEIYVMSAIARRSNVRQ